MARMFEIKCELAGVDAIRTFQSVSDAEGWLARAWLLFVTGRQWSGSVGIFGGERIPGQVLTKCYDDYSS
jgi:hypothetical protein